ncbi:MAG: T9SS type A sorting domain-containing protein [Bacteroidales bacterium]|nr:T9SS type A sorting domain-containing protein [Bacteroidales bacterium]
MLKKHFLILPFIAIVIGIGSVFFCGQDETVDYGHFKKRKLAKKARIKNLQEYFDGIRIPFGGAETGYPANYLLAELSKVKKHAQGFKSSYPPVVWVQRGPVNVGGRTRGLIVDPDDPAHNTWYAGSATGGVWKTTNGGSSWVCMSGDIPYQATTTLAMPGTNTSIIYMGTGESFPGSIYTTGGGIFKSTDKGLTWQHLESTANNENFRYVNRIVAGASNENFVLVATSKGILKSNDGGMSWQKTFSGGNVEDLVPGAPGTGYFYASVNQYGVIRSSDNGENWSAINNGLRSGMLRTELAVSPVNGNYVFASVTNHADSSFLYFSADKGDEWQTIIGTQAESYDFLGKQGGYNNAVAAHPYDEDIVYWGGVNLWKAELTGTVNIKNEVTGFYKEGDYSFLDFVSFTGNLFTGMNLGTSEGAIFLSDNDFVPVEIRFGPGIKQKAHRFYVPEGATSGVPASDYTYQDYVDVPFQVWDVLNNRQLMCSFRDQERDGAFNLYERTGDNYGMLGREYLFVHALTYNSAIPDINIKKEGGRSYKLLYFFWPTLAAGASWLPENLPQSKAVVKYEALKNRLAAISNVSDAYSAYSRKNIYNQSAGFGKQSIPGLHPDHHSLVMVPINQATGEFWILNGNDGGLAISKDKGTSFSQIKKNYLTTQFYGVAKKPYRDEYIGGMQDNGTWQSPIGYSAGLDKGYFFRLGGDGFEAIWHQHDSNKIMGSLYNNDIYRSVDHGKTWKQASLGIDEGDGPFITRLSNLRSNPSKVFAVRSNGLYYTNDFGATTWKKIFIGTGWLGNSGSLTSSHNIEVSLASDSVIWAGAAMDNENGYKIFVSQDQGISFSPAGFPPVSMPYLVSGIATHPVNKNVAFVLYGAAKKPKILRTNNMGQSWEDISGFGSDTVSSSGFPDVGCFSLMVFPDDTSRIWAGTEIGIMETTDNGQSWHYLISEMPSVTIWQMFMQNNQVVAATYGRGIWTYQYNEPEEPSGVRGAGTNQASGITLYPNPAVDELFVLCNENFEGNNIKISVYSIDGKVVMARKYVFIGQAIELKLERMPAGAYLLKAEGESGQIITKRFHILK